MRYSEVKLKNFNKKLKKNRLQILCIKTIFKKCKKYY